MPDLVECHSDFEYAERPTALTWEGQHLIIDKILEASRIPDGKRFRIQTTDGRIFELIYNVSDEWSIIQV